VKTLTAEEIDEVREDVEAARYFDHTLEEKLARALDQARRVPELEEKVARLKARVPVTRTVRPEVVLEGDTEELARYRKVAERAFGYVVQVPESFAPKTRRRLVDALAAVGMKVGDLE
jgi:hypothetical protein